MDAIGSFPLVHNDGASSSSVCATNAGSDSDSFHLAVQDESAVPVDAEVTTLFDAALDAQQFALLKHQRLLDDRNQNIRSQLLINKVTASLVDSPSAPQPPQNQPIPRLPQNAKPTHIVPTQQVLSRKEQSPRMARFQSSMMRNQNQDDLAAMNKNPSNLPNIPQPEMPHHLQYALPPQPQFQYIPSRSALPDQQFIHQQQQALLQQHHYSQQQRHRSSEPAPPTEYHTDPPVLLAEPIRFRASLDSLPNNRSFSVDDPIDLNQYDHTARLPPLAPLSQPGYPTAPTLPETTPREFLSAADQHRLALAQRQQQRRVEQQRYRPIAYIDDEGREVRVVDPRGYASPSDGGSSTAYYSHSNVRQQSYLQQQHRQQQQGMYYAEEEYDYENDGGRRRQGGYGGSTESLEPPPPGGAAGEPVNWVVVENEQNGVLLVMDATTGEQRGVRGAYGYERVRGFEGTRTGGSHVGGDDPMRYLNLVQLICWAQLYCVFCPNSRTDSNAFHHIPSSSPSNSASQTFPTHQQHQQYQHLHQPYTTYPLLRLPTTSHPSASLIKKQPATLMQHNHLSHLMTPHSGASGGAATATTAGGVSASPGSVSPTGRGTPSFLVRLMRRIRALSVYTLLILAAWYLKDPTGCKRHLLRIKKMVLAYTVLVFGGMEGVKRVLRAGGNVDLSMKGVVGVVGDGLVVLGRVVVVEGGRVVEGLSGAIQRLGK
ncbi:hypothetical protein HDU98_002653 [Podochytrium sp. JEL0797]|nr:hypothetical protein HDU98_002653 [Podochytrium sp. JEL0797]